MPEVKKGISRRRFLKLFGAAALTATGCTGPLAQQQPPGQEAEAIKETAEAYSTQVAPVTNARATAWAQTHNQAPTALPPQIEVRAEETTRVDTQTGQPFSYREREVDNWSSFAIPPGLPASPKAT